MKNGLLLLGRVSVILLAAALVIGITMRFVDTTATNRFAPERATAVNQTGTVVGAVVGALVDNVAGAGQSAATAPSGAGGEFRRERHSPRNQTFPSRLTFGLFGLAKNFVIIGVVILLVVGIERFFLRRAKSAAV